MLPLTLLHSDVSSPAVRLWAVVDDLARSAPDVAVTQAALAPVVGLTDRQLRRLLAELRDAGWLEVVRRGPHSAVYRPLNRARPAVDNPDRRRRDDRTLVSALAGSRPDMDVRSDGPGSYYAREEAEGHLVLAVDQRADGAAARRPSWCGSCDQPTRMLDCADGKVRRCPACHPREQAPF